MGGENLHMSGMKDGNREAVSVSHRQPSPQRHLLPFADVETLKS